MAEARTGAFQMSDLAAADAVAACAKHLGGYGAVDAGREYASVDVSERTLHEVHLPAFASAVAHGVASVMPSFNDLAGVPTTANAALLEGLLRGAWGFDGLIVSDYGAVAELIAHGVAADLAEAAALALGAGVDIDMMGDAYVRGLPDALRRGLVGIERVDAAVRRVLALKERLGLLDDPYRRCRAAPASATVKAERRALAREAARRSIVLLQDEAGLLPLDPAPARIAVLGPLADAGLEMPGPWSAAGVPEEAVGILDGLRAAFAGSALVHAQGVAIGGEDESGIEAAVRAAQEADLVVLCLGEKRFMSGEAASRARPNLPGRQRALAEAVLATGRPTVVLLSSGRPLMVPWLFERAGTVLATWFLGVEAGHAVAEVLSGAAEPTGRLPVSWPVDIGQIPVFYAQRPTGRPADSGQRYTSKYIDLPNQPLFPFGHGLSYARFSYCRLEVTPGEVKAGDRIEITVEVANEGDRSGEETLFFFVRDRVASVARPMQDLRGWQKIRLAPGERGTARLVLDTAALSFLGPDLLPRVEPGSFEIRVGPSADPRRQITAELVLEGA
jgi:beta-glucosidase